ncbi:MAG: hypothetical protein FWE03_05050 [Firmicutes bacterium]|nr:hypothetical protein [Bacillota bacterium]
MREKLNNGEQRKIIINRGGGKLVPSEVFKHDEDWDNEDFFEVIEDVEDVVSVASVHYSPLLEFFDEMYSNSIKAKDYFQKISEHKDSPLSKRLLSFIENGLSHKEEDMIIHGDEADEDVLSPIVHFMARMDLANANNRIPYKYFTEAIFDPPVYDGTVYPLPQYFSECLFKIKGDENHEYK